MPEWILNRSIVIGLAVIGGGFSLLASWCQSKALASDQVVAWMNKAAYVFMATSIVLFISAGFFGAEE